MQAVLDPIIGPAKPELGDLSGRSAIVTGGAEGIGEEISLALALAHCRVVMINRKEYQGDEAIQRIKDAAKAKGIEDVQISWQGCDLGDFKQVKEVFGKLAASEPRLDYLILSAGINSNQYGLAASGIDRHMSVNAIGHYYAINLLYPLIRKTSKLPNTSAPRIIFESSEMHRMARSDVHFGSVEELNNPELGPVELYGRTKLAMILYSRSLAEKVIKPNGDNVYVLAVHPGAVNTKMQEQWQDSYPGLMGKSIEAVTEFFGRSPEQGARSALWCCTAPEIVENNHQAAYVQDVKKVGGETTQAKDKFLAQALWELSERIIKDKVGPDALTSWDR